MRECRDFEDGIGRLICTIDLYGDLKTSYRPMEAETFSVPYRSLLPQGVDGLLVAGRCISCDDASFGAVRLMVGCALTGQAAGTAAAMSFADRVMPRSLDVDQLRTTLSENGVIL